MNEQLMHVVAALEITPGIISTYLSVIPENDLNIKRSEQAWTIREHVLHLDYVQDIIYKRILTIKDEDFPVIHPYFPENDEIDDQENKKINDILDSFKNKRNRQIQLVKELRDVDLKKEAMHDEYKRYNIYIILNHLLFHDYWHMYRIEELWLTKDKYFK
jgi:uncharacterized damage-inducible protein DinB